MSEYTSFQTGVEALANGIVIAGASKPRDFDSVKLSDCLTGIDQSYLSRFPAWPFLLHSSVWPAALGVGEALRRAPLVT